MIVLASSSAARRAMLAAAGVDFHVVVADVDEDAVKARGGSARAIAERLARAKSLLPMREKVSSKTTDEGSPRPARFESDRPDAVARSRDPSSDPLRGPPSPARGEGAWVIGCDQTLEFQGRSISKAKDFDELRANLESLRGRTHTLYSAIAAARDGKVVWDHTDAAHLTMRNVSDAFLDDYLARHGDQVRSSLGGYWFEGEGVQLFDRVEGDYFTILGMPLLSLLGFLRSVGALAS